MVTWELCLSHWTPFTNLWSQRHELSGSFIISLKNMQSYLSYKGNTKALQSMAAWRNGPGLRKGIYRLEPRAGPCWAPAVPWSLRCGGRWTRWAGWLTERRAGQAQLPGTPQLPNQSPHSGCSWYREKRVFKNAIAIVRIKYLRHWYKDTL